MFCFALVFFPLPDCSKCLSVAGQFPGGARERPPRRDKLCQPLVPWSSKTSPEGLIGTGRWLGLWPGSPRRRPAAPLGQGHRLPAVWGCSGLVFTFSRPGSPVSKVAPDGDDNLEGGLARVSRSQRRGGPSLARLGCRVSSSKADLG